MEEQRGEKDRMVEGQFEIEPFQVIKLSTQFQIEAMFEKNGFRSSNMVTKQQLKELFDRQYALNNMDEYDEDEIFSHQIFEQLWGHLQLLSDSTVKIQNVCKVLHDAIEILKDRLELINSPKGTKGKAIQLKKLYEKQKQLSEQLDMVDAQFDSHQEKIKVEINAIRMNIGKLQAQIQELVRDKQCFKAELKMLLLTIGEHKDEAIETKILNHGLMSMTGIQKRVNSNDLKLIFILTIICFVLELFILSYRLSFFTILGLLMVLYLLFIGYYTDKSVVYLLLYLVFSILLDLSYGGLNILTTFILNPIIYTQNTFLKYIGMALIVVSVVLRIILLIKLFKYRQIPKNLEYFDFWNEQIVLNRRNKHFKTLNQSISLAH